MIDLQIIENRDILAVKKVDVMDVDGIRTVAVRGLDFRSAQSVFINEVKSPSVVISTNTLLYAQVPDSTQARIKSVTVVSNRLTKTKRSTIRFVIGDTPSYISGLERLVQTFLKVLLQTPGTDAFSKKIGGGVLGAVAKTGSNTGDAASMTADVQLGVDRTRKQLIAIQANDATLALSERLLYARLLGARFSKTEQTLYCRIEIASQAMQSSIVSVGV